MYIAINTNHRISVYSTNCSHIPADLAPLIGSLILIIKIQYRVFYGLYLIDGIIAPYTWDQATIDIFMDLLPLYNRNRHSFFTNGVFIRYDLLDIYYVEHATYSMNCVCLASFL